eukprot:1136337-Pelagomonas_calceolata.AAC.4
MCKVTLLLLFGFAGYSAGFSAGMLGICSFQSVKGVDLRAEFKFNKVNALALKRDPGKTSLCGSNGVVQIMLSHCGEMSMIQHEIENCQLGGTYPRSMQKNRQFYASDSPLWKIYGYLLILHSDPALEGAPKGQPHIYKPGVCVLWNNSPGKWRGCYET